MAVNFRVLDERLSASEEYRQLKREIETAKIGFLRISETEALTLREASNKIIHAKDLQFSEATYQTHDPETGRTHVNPCYESMVTLTGTHYKKEWRCEIDLLIFAECVYEVLARWRCVSMNPGSTVIPAASI